MWVWHFPPESFYCASPKYTTYVKVDLCRVDRLRTNFEMSAVCFEINEESRRMK